MKSLTKLTFVIAAVLASVSFASCKDVIISADELPAQAQAFIQEYFPESSVSYIKKEREHFKTTYEVVLQDGSEIEFDSKGQWDKVDCKKSEVPESLIPATIAEYVKTNFPGQVVVKIDKEIYGYEIELSSDLELKFDKKGNLIRVDD